MCDDGPFCRLNQSGFHSIMTIQTWNQFASALPHTCPSFIHTLGILPPVMPLSRFTQCGPWGHWLTPHSSWFVEISDPWKVGMTHPHRHLKVCVTLLSHGFDPSHSIPLASVCVSMVSFSPHESVYRPHEIFLEETSTSSNEGKPPPHQGQASHPPQLEWWFPLLPWMCVCALASDDVMWLLFPPPAHSDFVNLWGWFGGGGIFNPTHFSIH